MHACMYVCTYACMLVCVFIHVRTSNAGKTYSKSVSPKCATTGSDRHKDSWQILQGQWYSSVCVLVMR